MTRLLLLAAFAILAGAFLARAIRDGHKERPMPLLETGPGRYRVRPFGPIRAPEGFPHGTR